MTAAASVIWLVAATIVDAASAAEDTAQLEARLDAARARLERAQAEVAELSATLDGSRRPYRRRLHLAGSGQALLGIQAARTAGSGGLRIAAVSPEGPAARAGLLPGDLLVAMDGRSLTGGDDPAEGVPAVEPGNRIALDVLRGGRSLKVVVVADAMAPGFAYFDESLPGPGEPPPLPPPASFRPAHQGFIAALAEVEFATMTPKLGRYFGAGHGVLVLHAAPANAFRLEDGDVLQAIDGRVPQSGPHAVRILLSYQPGERVKLELLRDRSIRSVEILLPAEGRRKGSYVPRSAPAPDGPATLPRSRP